MRYKAFEMIIMKKAMTLNLHVNPAVRQQAENVLKQPVPNADAMTDEQLHAALQAGIREIQNGDAVDAVSAFAQFREQHR